MVPLSDFFLMFYVFVPLFEHDIFFDLGGGGCICYVSFVIFLFAHRHCETLFLDDSVVDLPDCTYRRNVILYDFPHSFDTSFGNVFR